MKGATPPRPSNTSRLAALEALVARQDERIRELEDQIEGSQWKGCDRKTRLERGFTSSREARFA